MMEYKGTIYRPPVEANTFLLPVTEGCTHNQCRFCSMYKDVPFRMVDLSEMEEYLKEATTLYHRCQHSLKRIYLVGADPFALSSAKLERIIQLIRTYVPECETITMYAAVRNIMTKTDEELHRLKELGVDDLYVGIESALDDVLLCLNKGHTVQDALDQVQRLNEVGISHMDMLMLGAGGKGRGRESALAAAAMLNETKPRMILINTMSVFPETDLYADVQSGEFVPAKETEILLEEKLLLENLNLPDTYFWAAHSLDSVRIAGMLEEQREQMITVLERRIEAMDEKKFEKNFQRMHMHI